MTIGLGVNQPVCQERGLDHIKSQLISESQLINHLRRCLPDFDDLGIVYNEVFHMCKININRTSGIINPLII